MTDLMKSTGQSHPASTGADAGFAMAAGAPFRLPGQPVLSRAGVDRRAVLADDADQLAALWSRGRVLTVDQVGCAPARLASADSGSGSAAGSPAGSAEGTVELLYRPAQVVGAAPPDEAALLGEQDGVGYWALRITREDAAPPDWRRVWRHSEPSADSTAEQWLDLRSVGALLGPTDAGLFTTAAALLNWRRNAGFCAKCGSPTWLARSGWVSKCPGCGREEYPRTDPAVICLVHDGVGANGEHVLLARGANWPGTRYSVLAGFVEAGESLEDCVVREIAEEVGVRVSNVRYLGNQPWPFPRSLMIGFSAVADRAAPIRPMDGEIIDARWVSRAQVREVLAAGGATDELGLPGKVSIAGQMIEAWAAA